MKDDDFGSDEEDDSDFEDIKKFKANRSELSNVEQESKSTVARQESNGVYRACTSSSDKPTLKTNFEG